MTGYTDNDVVSPTVYADEHRLHAMFARMRVNEPIRWTEPDDYRPFWALTKHADVLEIERRNDVFLAGPRNRLLTKEEEERIWRKTGGGPLLRSIPTMDGPEHLEFRAVTRDWFRPANLRRLEAEVARQVEHVEPGGEATWLRTNFLGGPKSMPVHCHFGTA